ncbi:hypothetical protein PRIEUP_LOCUS8224 [Pristimantis euphronides]
MDDPESKVKRRVLPCWMTAGNGSRGKSCTTRSEKSPSRKRTVYCMNEKELVESALEILSQGRAQKDSEEKTKAVEPDSKADPFSDTDSEKKLPIFPAAKKPRTAPPSSDDSDHPKKGSDDDALKYVREIFFS